MKKNKIVLLVYSAIAVILGVLGAYFRYVLVTDYLEIVDSNVTHQLYKANSTLPEAFWIYVAACLLFALSPLVLLKREHLPEVYPEEDTLSSIASAFAGILILFSSAVFIFKTDFSVVRTGDEKTRFVFELISSIAGCFAFVFYAMDAFSRYFDAIGENAVKIRKMFSLFPVIWSVLHLMSVYFDKTLLLNSPIRIVHQTALTLIVFFTLVDARMFIGKPKKALFAFVALFSFIFLCIWTLPELSSAVSKGRLAEADTAPLLAEAGFVILSLSRLVSYGRSCYFPDYIDYGAPAIPEKDSDPVENGGILDEIYSDDVGDDTPVEIDIDENSVYEEIPPEDTETGRKKTENVWKFDGTEQTEETPETETKEEITEAVTAEQPEETHEETPEEAPAEPEETVPDTADADKSDADNGGSPGEDSVGDQLTFDQVIDIPEEESSPEEGTEKEDITPEETPEEEINKDPVRNFIEELGRRLDQSGEEYGGVPKDPEENAEDPSDYLEIQKGKVEETEKENGASGEERLKKIDVSGNELLKYISELTGEKLDLSRPETEPKKPEDAAEEVNKAEYSGDEILNINYAIGSEHRKLKSRNYRDVFESTRDEATETKDTDGSGADE